MGRKKTPAVKQKKAGSSVTSRNTRKGKVSSGHTDLNESFIQSAILTESDPITDVNTSQPPQVQDNSESILALLHKLDESNQALLRRVSDLESQKAVTVNSSGIQLQPAIPTLPTQHNLHSLASTSQNTFLHTSSDSQLNRVHSQIPRVDMGSGVTAHQLNAASALSQPPRMDVGTSQAAPSTLHAQQADTHATHFPSDGVLPGINVLRQNQNISQSVAQAQAKQEASQGKAPTKKSGRYNTTETVLSIPELRWPNEGFYSMQGKKRSTYDELSIPEWAVGQLTNIFHMQNPDTVKKALLQTILALKDATSLPWPAVRAAYGTSMHEVELGNLSWGDQMQWAINRLSASQIAMANTHISTNQQNQRTKICRYFNEGMCTFESHHGQYKHVCSFCAKLGKMLNHQESKCLNKQRGGGIDSKPNRNFCHQLDFGAV